MKRDPITWRATASMVTGIGLALLFAGVLTAVATAERWSGLDRPLVVGERAPMTVRLDVRAPGSPPFAAARVVVSRGEVVSPEQAAVALALRAERPPLRNAALGLFAAFALIGVLLTTYLRLIPRGRFTRTQATYLASLTLMALCAKLVLLFTPLSALVLPVGAVAMLLVVIVDRAAGMAAAVALGLVVSAMTPFDAPAAIVLGAQGIGAVLALGSPKRRRSFMLAGLAGGAAAAVAYVAAMALHARAAPWLELRRPFESGLIAASLGGLLSGGVAVALRGFVERLMGEVPKARLVELADLENPLLKKIASEAPGTWQHSLAMANMAEIAATAVGANGLLVRVGAYYHDLGKALHPHHYIENHKSGEQSPHDAMPPEKSAEAIFAHVVEGVKLARANGLPEAIVDFMHMHHGDGVLEYFWAKCQEQGNPRKLTVDAFRYPGKRPQSKETAILAIVDAVEAASRTLRQPDVKQIEALVQRIVYGKLHLGQLDESGLTMSELKTLANQLVETLKASHHVRIEYPWQREQRAETQRIVEQSLDSADAPRSTAPVSSSTTAAPGNGKPAEVAAPPPPAAQEIVLLREEDKITPGTVLIGAPPATQPTAHASSGPIAAAPDEPFAAGPDDGVPTVVPAVPTASMPPPRRRPPPPPPRGGGGGEKP